MISNRLRIGLILDSQVVQAWRRRLVERLGQSPSVEIAAVIQVEEAEPLTRRPDGLLEKLDKKLFLRGADALEKQSLADLLAGIPKLQVGQLEQAKLDILVNCSGRDLPAGLGGSAQYGLWSVTFGDEEISPEEQAACRDTLQGRQLTAAMLVCQSPDPRWNRRLYQAKLSVYKLSPARNRNAVLWFAAAFPTRLAERLQKIGAERFLQAAEEFIAPAAKPERPLSLWEVVKGAAALSGRILKEFSLRLLRRDTWYLLWDDSPQASFDIRRYKEILPPPDRFWADPFIEIEGERTCIFVEEYLYGMGKGRLSVLELDAQGKVSPAQTILDTAYHLSYPFIFQHEGRRYLVPESSANRTIDLYECVEFPTRWQFRQTLMQGDNAVDSTLFFHQGLWWLFSGMNEGEGAYPDVELFLFFSKSLFSGEWTPHPLNPVVSDVSTARPAGRIYEQDGKLYRPSQDCSASYGNRLNINEILAFSETEYAERKIRTIQPNWDGKVRGTHTFNRQGQLTVIDAFYRRSKLG